MAHYQLTETKINEANEEEESNIHSDCDCKKPALTVTMNSESASLDFASKKSVLF